MLSFFLSFLFSVFLFVIPCYTKPPLFRSYYAVIFSFVFLYIFLLYFFNFFPFFPFFPFFRSFLILDFFYIYTLEKGEKGKKGKRLLNVCFSVLISVIRSITLINSYNPFSVTISIFLSFFLFFFHFFFSSNHYLFSLFQFQSLISY